MKGPVKNKSWVSVRNKLKVWRGVDKEEENERGVTETKN